MPRYLSGLALAFLLTGVVIAATIVPMTMLAGRRPSLKTVVGPTLTVSKAAIAGAATRPLMLLVSWLAIRGQNETFGQLLSFWARMPMELAVGLVPFAAAGALFAGWLAGGE